MVFKFVTLPLPFSRGQKKGSSSLRLYTTKTFKLYSDHEPGHPSVFWRRVEGGYSESKPLKHKASTVLSCAALPEAVCTALAALYLGLQWHGPEGRGSSWCLGWLRAADMLRLLASLGHMNWAISKVFTGKVDPANELILHSRCTSPGSKVVMFESRQPHEWEASIPNIVLLFVWNDSEVG